MGKQYRLMIYFVVTTLHFYRKDIWFSIKPEVFREKNEDIIKRVFDEGLSLFNYELSHNQMMRGISAYINSELHPQSVKNTKVATLNFEMQD